MQFSASIPAKITQESKSAAGFHGKGIWHVKLESFRFEEEDDYAWGQHFILSFLAYILLKQPPRKASLYFFSPQKLVCLFMLKEVKPFPDC